MRPSHRPEAPPLERLSAYWAGRVDYREAWGWQRALEEARRARRIGDVLLLLEHPSTYTIGRRGTRDHLLIDEAALQRLGSVCLEVDRGGDITYHGPGQLVGYPILDLRDGSGDVNTYLRGLESSLIDTLAGYGVVAGRLPGFTGVWIGQEKIAAIGIKVRESITSHGFALNVSTDLTYFGRMVPCGIVDKGVTSMDRWVASAPTLPEVAQQVAPALARVLERELRWGAPGELETLLELATLESQLISA
jgi:lipoyl(octanoyl) transferase